MNNAKKQENSRIGKTRDLFVKIADSRETFYAKMGIRKGKKGKDLTKEEIKKRWQEYTKELYKKSLNDLDNCDGVVS